MMCAFVNGSASFTSGQRKGGVGTCRRRAIVVAAAASGDWKAEEISKNGLGNRSPFDGREFLVGCVRCF